MFAGYAGAKLFHKYRSHFYFHCILCISDRCSCTAAHTTLFECENALEALLGLQHLIIFAQTFGPTAVLDTTHTPMLATSFIYWTASTRHLKKRGSNCVYSLNWFLFKDTKNSKQEKESKRWRVPIIPNKEAVCNQ